jgi:hypothetical protein
MGLERQLAESTRAISMHQKQSQKALDRLQKDVDALTATLSDKSAECDRLQETIQRLCRGKVSALRKRPIVSTNDGTNESEEEGARTNVVPSTPVKSPSSTSPTGQMQAFPSKKIRSLRSISVQATPNTQQKTESTQTESMAAMVLQNPSLRKKIIADTHRLKRRITAKRLLDAITLSPSSMLMDRSSSAVSMAYATKESTWMDQVWNGALALALFPWRITALFIRAIIPTPRPQK